MDSERQLLTVAELADYLRTTTSAIHTSRHRGELPASLGFRQGRKLLFRRADIDRWIDAQVAQVAQ